MEGASRYILMIEDDRDDRFFTEQTIADIRLPVTVRFLPDSSGLERVLKEAGTPALILVDFNAVPDNGLEVLHWLKGQEAYRSIPVVVLSELRDKELRDRCYAAGASTFVQKPSRIRRTHEMIETFFRYWLEVAEV